MEICKLCQDKYHRIDTQNAPIDDLEIYRAAVAIFAGDKVTVEEAVEYARLLAKEVKGE